VGTTVLVVLINYIYDKIKFQRHIKVIAQANPFDPEWEDYFKQRNQKQVKKSSFGLRPKI